MVNYKRIVSEVAFLALLAATVIAAPAPPDSDKTIYDQRQNGSENIRVNVDGVIFAVIPPETLDDIGDLMSFGDIIGLEDYLDLRPSKPSQTEGIPLLAEGPQYDKPEEFISSSEKPQESKPQDEKPLENKPQDGKPQENKPHDENPQENKPQDEKLQDEKPQAAKPLDAKPLEAKPLEEKPLTITESPLSDVSLSSDNKRQRTRASTRKQVKGNRLKNRLAQLLVPLIRKTRHH